MAWNGVSTSFIGVVEVAAGLTPAGSCGQLEARERAAKGPKRRWILGLCSGGGELARGGLSWSVSSVKEGCLVLVLANGFMGFAAKLQWLGQELAGDGRLAERGEATRMAGAWQGRSEGSARDGGGRGINGGWQ